MPPVDSSPSTASSSEQSQVVWRSDRGCIASNVRCLEVRVDILKRQDHEMLEASALTKDLLVDSVVAPLGIVGFRVTCLRDGLRFAGALVRNASKSRLT